MADFFFHPDPSSQPGAAHADYQAEGFTLVVGPADANPVAMYRISADTLTLLFSPARRILVGFDAYTNSLGWERRLLALPTVSLDAALVCDGPFDEHGIAPALKQTPRFVYSASNGLLCIRLDGGAVVQYVRCLDNTVCALGTRGELVEVWVEGVHLDGEQ